MDAALLTPGRDDDLGTNSKCLTAINTPATLLAIRGASASAPPNETIMRSTAPTPFGTRPRPFNPRLRVLHFGPYGH